MFRALAPKKQGGLLQYQSLCAQQQCYRHAEEITTAFKNYEIYGKIFFMHPKIRSLIS